MIIIIPIAMMMMMMMMKTVINSFTDSASGKARAKLQPRVKKG